MKRAIAPLAAMAIGIGLGIVPVHAEQVIERPSLFRTDELIGEEVYYEDREIGEIYSMILNPDTGVISHALLSVGGLFGIGDEIVAVPWEFLDPRVKDGFSSRLNKETLLDAPTRVDSDPITWEGNWVGRTDAFYKVENPEFSPILDVSDVVGESVYRTDGTALGTVDELLVDPVSGAIRYAIMQSTALMGESLAPLPWEVLKEAATPDRKPVFIVQPDPAYIAAGPTFLNTAWPNYNDIAWNNRVYSYYGVTPYYGYSTVAY